MVWKATGLGSGFSSVSVADGRLYTQAHIQGEEHLIALDEATGRKLWAVVLGPAERVPYPGSRSTPTVDGASIYLETVAGDVVCPDAQNAQVVWRIVYANNAMRSQYGGFFLHDGYVDGCSTSIPMCMNFLTGEVAWKSRSVGMGSVLYADGHFIMRGDGGEVALVEATAEQYCEKGRFDQPDRSDRPARTYPVVTGGRLYLRDKDVLLCYDVRER